MSNVQSAKTNICYLKGERVAVSETPRAVLPRGLCHQGTAGGSTSGQGILKQSFAKEEVLGLNARDLLIKRLSRTEATPS